MDLKKQCHGENMFVGVTEKMKILFVRKSIQISTELPQGQGGRTHLVSPAMAAAAAINGHFVDVSEL